MKDILVGKKMKKILVVDDSKISLKTIDNILSDKYETVIVKSGAKALEILEKTTFNLVLLDLQMPDMDGHEVCKKIKSNEKTKDMPVIFLTATTDIRNQREAIAEGAIDFINKPVKPEVLLEVIEKNISKF